MDRSVRDYHLACILLEKGLSLNEAKEAIKIKRQEDGVEEKYKGKAYEHYLNTTVERANRQTPRTPRPSINTTTSNILRVEDARSFDTIKNPTWLVENLISEVSLSAIVGDERTKKSWFALELGLCVAMGRPVAGRFVTQKSKVLCLQLEDPPGRVKYRYNKLVAGFGAVPSYDMFKLILRTNFDFMYDEHWNYLYEYCKVYQPKLIIVDTLMQSQTAKITDPNEASKFVKRLYGLRDGLQCSLFFVHHTTKKSIGVPQTMIGSRPLGAAIENILLVQSKEGSNTTDVWVKGKDAENFGFSYTLTDSIVNGQPAMEIMS